MGREEFRRVGHELVDRLADFFVDLPNLRVGPAPIPDEVLPDEALPEEGSAPAEIVESALQLLIPNSVHTGHPRFWGYVCSSAAPLGALAELLSAAVNVNAASTMMAPIGTRLEQQVIRWIADLLGYPRHCGGVLVSGGNMANFLGLLAARHAAVPWDVRQQGLVHDQGKALRIYASSATHTWLQKAVDSFGFGLNAIHVVEADRNDRMIPDALERAIRADRANGLLPLMVIGSAGTVATGAVDPLLEIAHVAKAQRLWMHVDGAYGAPAVAVPGTDPQLAGLREADSVAIDPHKWLYVPIEAGCVLVRDPSALAAAFSFRPSYYRFADQEHATHYYEQGLQNSRALRAMKVWMILRQLGRRGIAECIADDIALSQRLFARVREHAELEALSQSLSTTTFRYLPPAHEEMSRQDLDDVNVRLLDELNRTGRFYLSNATVHGVAALRTCIVNFRTEADDLDALVDATVALGRTLSATPRSSE